MHSEHTQKKLCVLCALCGEWFSIPQPEHVVPGRRCPSLNYVILNNLPDPGNYVTARGAGIERRAPWLHCVENA
jgi:hypothetical protein